MSAVVLFTQHPRPGRKAGGAERISATSARAPRNTPSSAAQDATRTKALQRDSEACRLSRQIASAVLAIPLEEIAQANRGEAEICTARHVAMYLAHVIFQVPLTAIGADFGRDRTSVAHAIRRVEDQRDRHDFDAQLTRLEALAGECRALLDGDRGEA